MSLRSPNAAQRGSIIVYGALLLSVLLGATAISIRRQTPATPVAAVVSPTQAASATAAPATKTQAPSATHTPAPSSTPVPSATERPPSPTARASVTPESTAAGSATLARTATATRTAPATATQAPTQTALPSATATSTRTAIVFPSLTHTPVRTPTPTHTAIVFPSLTPTSTPSPTLTQTQAPSQTPVAPAGNNPWPTPGPGAANRKVCVPILMYHHIGYAPINADSLRLGLTTSPELFEQHLAYFKASNIVPITLNDLIYALAQGQPLPEKRVIITIDDGYDDAYTYAFPLLKEYGFSATLFVATSFVDNEALGYVTWDQVKEMSDAGIEIEPHTKDHVDLRRRSRAYLVYQILGSKESVEAHTGQIAHFFAYPAGAYDEDVIAMLKELNFWAAVTTDSGVNHTLANQFVLKRMRVSQSIDIESMHTYMRFCGYE